MRGGWFLTVAALVLSGCTANGSSVPEPAEGFAPIPGAGWQPGYAFSYSFGETYDLDVHVVRDGRVVEDNRSTEDFPDELFGTLRVLSTTIPDGPVPMYLVQFEPVDGEAFLAGVRQSDLMQHDVIVEHEDKCLTCYARATGIRYESFGNYPWVQFPLGPASTWNGTVEAFGASSRGMEVRSHVEGMETRDGPFGPVEAVRIEHDLVFDLPGIAEDATELLEANGLRDVKVEVEATGLDLVHYAPSLHDVLSDEVTMRVEMRFEATTRGGAPVNGSEVHTYHQLTRLTDAQLESVADPGLAGVLATLTRAGPGQPGHPGGLIPSPVMSGAPTVTIVEAPASINVADQAPAQWTATTTGNASGPVQFRLLDALGTEVALSTGPVFTHTFSHPGVYYVEAALLSNGKLAALDWVLVAAHYEAELPFACEPVVASGVAGCDAVEFPVGAGPTVASISVVSSSDAALPSGTLYVTEGDGTQHTVATADGAGAGRYSQDLGAAGTWSARYDADAAAGLSGTMGVLVLPVLPDSSMPGDDGNGGGPLLPLP